MVLSERLLASDSIAHELNARNTDVNELSKCVGVLRDLAQKDREGTLFFEYLDTVIAEGRAVVRSGRTIGYYKAIRAACHEHLRSYQDDPEAMAWILGWAARLMRYYAVEDKLDRKTRPPRVRSRSGKSRVAAEGGRRTGTVKWFKKGKGYGFIQPDGGGDDFFVHKSQTPGQRGLDEKQRVSFVVGKGPKGRPQAQDVRPE